MLKRKKEFQDLTKTKEDHEYHDLSYDMEYRKMKRTLVERLDQGPVICAEGFLFEVEKKGLFSIWGICSNGFFRTSRSS